MSVPALVTFSLVDVGCSQAQLSAAIALPDEVRAGQPAVLNYSLNGITLEPTGQVCGECVQLEEYCTQQERYDCNCHDERKRCNCRTERYECNCRIESKDCNCRDVCTRYGTYACGRHERSYSCSKTRTYQGTCTGYRFTTCSYKACVGSYCLTISYPCQKTENYREHAANG
jgi:hypothetical protein